MNLTRRSFFKLMAGAAVAAAIPVAFKRRDPYVRVGEVVDYIGPRGKGFIGGQVVSSVGEWDGTAYPVKCWNNCYGRYRVEELYRDVDLSCFNREVPRDFWPTHSMKKWVNVHSWVRSERGA